MATLVHINRFRKKPRPQQPPKIKISFGERDTSREFPPMTTDMRGVPEIIDKTKEDYPRQRFMEQLLERRRNQVSIERAPPDIVPPSPDRVPSPPRISSSDIASARREQPDRGEERTIIPKAARKIGKAKKKKKTIVLHQRDRGDKPGPSNEASATARRAPKRRIKEVISEREAEEINDIFKPRLPTPGPKVILKASSYFMNNREKFVNFVNTLFNPYISEIESAKDDVSCENKAGEFSLLIHQKIVRDYINNLTPYRGLLLYHGLGSGKTCSAIAIAEGIQTAQKIIVMTPASLRTNFHSELKKCGNPLYKYNQYWEFISVEENDEILEQLHAILQIPRAFIKKQGGAWFVDIRKKNNFNTLTTTEHASLDKQLTEMIKSKYNFINYNGLRLQSLKTKAFFSHAIKKKHNPFDNHVIIIDEAHNFVSRIINKLSSKKENVSTILYKYIKSAKNARIIFLTGTPIINYPNEIAVLYNMLRGNIITFEITLNVRAKKRIDDVFLKRLFTEEGLNASDFIQYSSGSRLLQITRNPFGFISKYKQRKYTGVLFDKQGNITDEDFLKKVQEVLGRQQITFRIDKNVKIKTYTALPEKLEDFNSKFFNKEKILQNSDLFKRRILGLTSYYRSATEQLLPKLNELVIEKIPMSRYQIGVYERVRKQERDREKKDAKRKRVSKKKGEDIYTATSTYRIFSRAFCNFVFPPEKKRPFPVKEGDGEMGEDVLDNASVEELRQNPDGMFSADDEKEKTDRTYGRRITEALKFLKTHDGRLLSKEGLATHSPKFLRIIENITNAQNIGSHLIYSQFRTLEGIGILKLVLEANGFVEFKIKKTNITWEIQNLNKLGKPSFVLYTGTESVEEKEIIRNIFNGTWKNVPSAIVDKLPAKNNNYGEIIKIFMITAAGAEGISLRNIRFVHITEPYWHPIRMEQVIGRARRICSHHNLLREERNVTVFLYLMTFSRELLEEEGLISQELKIHDLSKRDQKTPLTTDEALFEISEIKRLMNQQLLTAIKESSIDCSIYSRSGATEIKTCFSFGDVTADIYSYVPSIESSAQMKTAMEHKEKKKIKYTKLNIPKGGHKGTYAKRIYKTAGVITKVDIYDMQSVLNIKRTGQAPILLGEVRQNEKKKWVKVTWF